MRCKLLAVFAAFWAIVGIVVAAPVEKLLGAPGLTDGQVKAAVGSMGRVLGQDDGGFWRVQLASSTSEAKFVARVKAQGIKHVLPYSARFVQTNSLQSVRDHIVYKKARNQMTGSTRGGGFYEALEYYLEPRVGPDGFLDQDAILRAAAHRDQMPPAELPGESVGGNSPIGTATWSYVGPRNLDIPYQRYYGTPPLSGRVNAIAYAPSNASVVYIATAGGGVWRTADGGTSWSFRSNGWAFLHTTSIAVHPTNPDTVLCGTGDYYGFFGVQTVGLRRSTNGGASWSIVGSAQFGNQIVTRVMFQPDSPNICIALTAATPGGSTGDIYRSTDGGLTWAATDAPSGRWDDIDYMPTTGGYDVLWAVGVSGGGTPRLYRSTNSGLNWNAMTSPTASSQAIMDVACSKLYYGRLWVLAPGNNTAYRSLNSAGSWTNLNLTTAPGFPNLLNASNPLYNWSQDTYDLHITAARAGDAEYLYIGLITLAVSANAGTTWTDVGESYLSSSELHNDQHCMAVHPTNGLITMVGGDGGIFQLTYIPGLVSTFTPKNGPIQSTQFYHMSLHPTLYSSYLLGGTQDNASPTARGDLNNWKNLQGGDGGWSGYDASNPSVHYSSSQRGAFFRYTSLADTSGDLISPTDASGNLTWSAKFIAPMLTGNGNTNVLVGADSRIKRWSGTVGVWSQSNSCGSPVRTLVRGISNTSRVYAGCDDGSVWRSNDGGNSVTKIDTTLPNAPIGGIACRWTDSTQVIVGLMGTTGGLFRCVNTTAASPTWQDIGGSGATGLPDSPVNCVMWDPHNALTYYVGTDVGAFMTTNGGSTWRNMNALGLGNVHVNAFAIPPTQNYLYAATFGRGIWRIPIKNVGFTNFTIPQSSIYGDRSMIGTLTLSDPAPPGATAFFSEGAGNAYFSAPTSTTFSQGATTKTFTISTSTVFSNTNAVLYANVFGTVRSVSFTILPYPTITSYNLSKYSMYGGPSITGTATLSAPAPFAGTISFSDDSAAVASPGAVAIAAGTTSKSVPIGTSKVAATTTVTMTASYKSMFRVRTLTLHPYPTIIGFTFTPNPVYAGLSTMAKVTLSGPCPITTQVGISETSTVVAASGTRTMLAGQTTLQFSVPTSPVVASQTVPVTARIIGDIVPAFGANLTLNPLKLTSITVTPPTIVGGNLGKFDVFLNAKAPAPGAVVACASDRPEAAVPSSVTIPTGAVTVRGDVRTAIVAANVTAVLSASYNGSVVRTTLLITP